MSTYLVLKLVHVLRAAILLGTGLGTAFFMYRAAQSGNPFTAHATANSVVMADWIFTTPAVVMQPITGLLLMLELGYGFDSLWFFSVVVLYAVAGGCWIPVVYIQYRLRNLAAKHEASGYLPANFYRLTRTWTILGVVAFSAVLVLFFLMIFRPGLA